MKSSDGENTEQPLEIGKLYIELDIRITLEDDAECRPHPFPPAASELFLDMKFPVSPTVGQNWIAWNAYRYWAHTLQASQLLHSAFVHEEQNRWLIRWLKECARIEASLLLWAIREKTRWQE